MTRLSQYNQYYLQGDGTAIRNPPFTLVGTVIMQTDVAVNDVPGSPITLTNHGGVTKTVDGYSSGIPSFVFTRAAAAGVGIDDHADLDIAGDFTVESWIKTPFSGSLSSIAPSLWANDRLAANSLNNPRLLAIDRNGLVGNFSLYSSSNWRIEGSTVFNDGLWHHVALVRIAGVFTMYVDGVQDGGTYTYATPLTTNGMGILDWSTNGSMDAELAMWRFTNGTGLYTGTFTPPVNLLA